MTGHLTTQAAQARTLDLIRTAEHHRQAHAEQLDRLSGRWLPFQPRRVQSTTTPALVPNQPCCD